MVYDWFALKLSIAVSLLDILKQDQHLTLASKLSEYDPRFAIRYLSFH